MIAVRNLPSDSHRLERIATSPPRARTRGIPKCSTEPRFQPDSDDLFCGTLKATDKTRKKHLFFDDLTRKNSLRFDVESRMFSRTWKILDLAEFK